MTHRLVPMPELCLEIRGNKCCNNDRSSRVIFDDHSRKFEIRNSSCLCCICGAGEIVKDENIKSWEIFLQTLQGRYGVSSQENLIQNCEQSKKKGRKLTVAYFNALVAWAKDRSQSDLASKDRRWIDIHLNVRVQTDKGEEDFNPEIIASNLRTNSPSQIRLSDGQIRKIVELVVDELKVKGKNKVDKSEIAEIVNSKLKQIEPSPESKGDLSPKK